MPKKYEDCDVNYVVLAVKSLHKTILIVQGDIIIPRTYARFEQSNSTLFNIKVVQLYSLLLIH